MSRLDIRELTTLAEFARAGELIQRVWGSTPARSPLNVQQLPAMAHAGCQISGAFDGDQLVAATMAFVGLEDGEPILHSHVTGVDPERQGSGIGLAMKHHQRQWCLDRGISVVTWTFDPLVLANARFNLVRLRARGVEYLRNFYGVMDDALNRDDPTDRLVARWDLGAFADTDAPDAPTSGDLLRQGADAAVVDRGSPVVHPVTGPVRLVALPADIVELRVDQSPVVGTWRQAVRSALEAALSDGHVVDTVTADGHLVTRLGQDGRRGGP